ncbi:Uncharacterised protein [Serratia marcescens]|nr:Uncharacterised protein [Serratia marcescens]CVB51566.1 Uncharacterised protein [Serratia marcescens]CVB93020.1 Uncharacterised protein [Serratia marcescens]CVF18766.1 Uncharacterised protein [Serratia marcescens]
MRLKGFARYGQRQILGTLHVMDSSIFLMKIHSVLP